MNENKSPDRVSVPRIPASIDDRQERNHVRRSLSAGENFSSLLDALRRLHYVRSALQLALISGHHKMSSFVITWNPEKWSYDELRELIDEFNESGVAHAQWRFQSYRQANIGDRVYLLKQGRPPKGIFGVGTIEAAPYWTGTDTPSAPILIEQLVDPVQEFLVSELEARIVLPSSVLNSQFSGVGVASEDAIALDELIAGKASVELVPSSGRYIEALRTMIENQQLGADDRDMLLCHYRSPDFTINSREMSALMGWAGKSANKFYGSLGKRLSENLGWMSPYTRKSGKFFVSSMVVGSRSNDDFEWVMRPQMVAALRATYGLAIEPSSHERRRSSATVIEKKLYEWQRRLERDSRAAALAKQRHGNRCQACDLQFKELYGEIGSDYIEAHHLVPLATLVDGEERIYTADDFAVLCSNCHRMIHRWPTPTRSEPWDLSGFRMMVQANKDKSDTSG